MRARTRKSFVLIALTAWLVAGTNAASADSLGVDRGAAFSKVAAEELETANAGYSPDGEYVITKTRGKCLYAVKYTLKRMGTIGEDGTLSAKDFVKVMRQKAKGYKELSGYTSLDMKKLKATLPVGSIIIYEALDDKQGFSRAHGHIDMVANVDDGSGTSYKSLVSDHVSKYDHGWGWLGSKKKNINMFVFVPTRR